MPKIRGLYCLHPQKSSDKRNNTINKMYTIALYFFGNQKGSFFKLYFPPNKHLCYFLVLRAGKSKKNNAPILFTANCDKKDVIKFY